MVYLEFAYLYRRGRVRIPAAVIYANLSASFGVSLCGGQAFTAVAAAASELEWTNDPFDRIIVAQSQCNANSRLVTADETIRRRYERALCGVVFEEDPPLPERKTPHLPAFPGLQINGRQIG